jgi:exosortase family protein XrtF
MKKYFITYGPFIKFLIVFFVTYIALSFVYKQYLGTYENNQYPIDPFTESVSAQVKGLSNFFGANADIQKYIGEKWTRLLFNDIYVARIVEGCNAVSVMILFVSFVISFARKFLPALIFCLIGIVLIHILNITRIAALGYFIYKMPEHTHILHGVLFPLVIYGFVFVLWVVWVRNYSGFISKKDGQKN